MRLQLLSASIFSSLILCNLNAQTIIDYDSLSSEARNFNLGVSVDEDRGPVIATGDFNGDGLGDIAYSASDDRDNYRIGIYFGPLSTNSTQASVTLSTIQTIRQFGWEIGSGDLNNDGIDDLIVGITEYNDSRGRLYVLYGKSTWQGSTDLAGISASEGFYVEGLTPSLNGDAGSRLGDGYAVGDFDDDGLNDLYVSAPFSNTSFDQFKGEAYLIFGSSIQNQLTVGLDTLTNSAGMKIYTTNTLDGVGGQARFEDLNNDGIDDLLMAAKNSWSQGRIYTLFGTSTPPDSISISSINRGVEGFTIFGSFSPTLSQFATDFDFGDFNGDGLPDLVASAPRFGGVAGRMYIVWGKAGGFTDNIYPSVLQPGKGITIVGDTGDYLGTYLAVNDFNEDGIDDLIFTGGIDNLTIPTFYQNNLRVLLGTRNSLPDTLDIHNPNSAFPLVEIIPESNKFDVGHSIVASNFNALGDPFIALGTQFENNEGNEAHQVQLLLDFVFEADTDTQAEPIFGGGSGTEDAPYLISTISHLDSVRYLPGMNYKLTADIELNYDKDIGWIPIGYDRNDHYLVGDRVPFSGCFDGNGHTISNLEINNRGRTVGLFYSVSGCVKNLTIDGATITYIPPEDLPDSIKSLPPEQIVEEFPRFAGAVAGRVEVGGVIDSVTVLNVSIQEGSGGSIVGWNEGVIRNTYGQGTLYDANQVGGIASVNFGTILRSAFEGSIFNILNSAGGIAGTNFEGQISESYSNTSVLNAGLFGGVAGIYQYGFIQNNYSGFSILDSSSVGGIVGLFGVGGSPGSVRGPLSIVNNYSFGTVESKTTDIDFYRGIIGQGFVSTDDSLALSTRITSNYWNKDLFGEEDNLIGYRVSGADRTNLEMKQELTFETWNFDSVWTIDEGVSFPYLQNNPPKTKPGENIIISNEFDELPLLIKLYQNYPNPFNPSTSITFELNQSSEVRLEVFDMLGRSVAVLVSNEFKQAGVHSVRFNGSELSSGVYLYRLSNSNGLRLSKRFTLIK